MQNAAVLKAQNDLQFTKVKKPSQQPGPDQVLLAMKAVGICGSDVHYWTHGRIGDFVLEAPMILGHEAAGQVLAVGSNVRHLSVGDRVALEPGISCRQCSHCTHGTYNLCPDMRFHATPPIDGSLQETILHPASHR